MKQYDVCVYYNELMIIISVEWWNSDYPVWFPNALLYALTPLPIKSAQWKTRCQIKKKKNNNNGDNFSWTINVTKICVWRDLIINRWIHPKIVLPSYFYCFLLIFFYVALCNISEKRCCLFMKENNKNRISISSSLKYLCIIFSSQA